MCKNNLVVAYKGDERYVGYLVNTPSEGGVILSDYFEESTKVVISRGYEQGVTAYRTVTHTEELFYNCVIAGFAGISIQSFNV